jgi:hypothetical protein
MKQALEHKVIKFFNVYTLVMLTGSSSFNEGNVLARLATGAEGPVCDDSWDMNAVIYLSFFSFETYFE